MAKKSRKKRKTYDKTFKMEAVNLVKKQGYTQAEACRSLGISSPILLGRWIKEFNESGKESFPGKGVVSDEMAELLRVKRENKALKQELEFLKKAANYFASQKKNGSK